MATEIPDIASLRSHYAAGLEALTYRYGVPVPAQRGYQKWKRKLPGSASLSHELTQKVELLGPATLGDDDCSERDTQWPAEAESSVRRSSARRSRPIAPQASPNKTRLKQYVAIAARPPPGIPQNVLQRGNSDPFDTLPVPLNPSSNELITFTHDYLRPALFAGKIRNSATAKNYMSRWQDLVFNLHDEGQAFAYLSAAAAVLSTISHDMRHSRQSLLYRTQSSAIVRARLVRSRGRHESDPGIMYTIFTLLLAELLARNYPGAAIHAEMLKFLFQLQLQKHDPNFDLKFLNYVVYFDSHRAAMSLSRPVFDMGGWLVDCFRPVWEVALMELQWLPTAAAQELDASIEDETLRNALIDARRLTLFVKIVVEGGFTISTWLYMASNGVLYLGRLLNYYLDINSVVERSEYVSQSLYARSYASLAAVFWCRRVGNTDNVPVGSHGSIYDAGTLILSRLRETLSQAESLQEDASRYERVRLWVLFIGAGSEQDRAKPGTEPEKQWFNVKLAEQARRMGLCSWFQVREILQGFLYTDDLAPHGSLWFCKTMSVNEELDLEGG